MRLGSLLVLAACLTCCSAFPAYAGESPILVVDGLPQRAGGSAELIARDLRLEFVGIIIDGVEASPLRAYRRNDGFFLPVTLLRDMGIRVASTGAGLLLDTPGGEVQAEPGYFYSIDGQTYFHTDLLDDRARVSWRFQHDRYALAFEMPWWRRDDPEKTEETPSAAPDFAPARFGLTQLRVDHIRYANDHTSYAVNQMMLRGRADEGIWRAELYDEEDSTFRASDYYWLRDFDHIQALVGNQQVQINPILPGLQSTGVQGLYNSMPRGFDPYNDQTRAQYIRHLGIPAKEIEGLAQPGAIAELRIDNRLVARQRVRLDGTYAFRDVTPRSLEFARIEVHILDQRSLIVLDVQDFTQTSVDLLLERGQTVGFAGAGVNGNPLDPRQNQSGGAAFGLYRHGLSERVTLEAGLQSVDGQLHQVVGATASLGRRWTGSASLGHHDGALAISTDLYGRGLRWDLTARSLGYQDAFLSPASADRQRHELRFEYWANDRLSVGAYGQAEARGDESDRFLLPGFSWRVSPRSSLQVWGDTDGHYRANFRRRGSRDRLEVVHDSSGAWAEYRYFASDMVEFIAGLSDGSRYGSPLAELGGNWYPRRYDDRSLVSASVLAGASAFGYRVNWRMPLIAGFNSDLELRDEPRGTDAYDPGFELRWTLTLDLSFVNGRPLPAHNEFTNTRTGAIAGRLDLSDGRSATSAGIEAVTLLVNGVPHPATMRGSHFYVDGIRPGVHTVSLDAEHLPMTLSADGRTYRVKVAPAATTRVDFAVRAEYGLSGRVIGPEGAAVAGLTLQVYHAGGGMVVATRTDQYGTYRVTGLPPGGYRLVLGNGDEILADRTVAISDHFVFDADLQVETLPPSVRPGPGSLQASGTPIRVGL